MRWLCVLLAMCLGAAGAYAQSSPMTKSPVNHEHVSQAIMDQGELQGIMEADAAKALPASLALKENDQTIKNFTLTPATTIYGINGQALTLKDLKAGDHLKITSVKKSNDVMEAVAVYVIS